ncbi:MAG: hypothetical protein NVSMB25_17190 [Thermoleophilaceae bacterium]
MTAGSSEALGGLVGAATRVAGRRVRKSGPEFDAKRLMTLRRPEPGVVAWRAQQLRRCGVEPQAAEQLAEDSSVDLHALFALVDLGCPARLAARILAPLEVGPCDPRDG